MSGIPTKNWTWPVEGEARMHTIPDDIDRLEAEVAQLRRDRDELIAALEEAAKNVEEWVTDQLPPQSRLYAGCMEPVNEWRALIARAKGGTNG